MHPGKPMVTRLEETSPASTHVASGYEVQQSICKHGTTEFDVACKSHGVQTGALTKVLAGPGAKTAACCFCWSYDLLLALSLNINYHYCYFTKTLITMPFLLSMACWQVDYPGNWKPPLLPTPKTTLLTEIAKEGSQWKLHTFRRKNRCCLCLGSRFGT